MDIKPNYIQQEALIELQKSKQQGNTKSLVVLPSGLGKTYLAAFETFNFRGRILYLVHRKEILDQAKEAFKKVHNFDESDIGYFVRKDKQINKKLVLASIQTFSKKYNLFNIKPDTFDYVIVDEWHHVGAESYKRILNYLKPSYVLGLTATPFRYDGKDILSQTNFNIPYQMNLHEGIKSGLLSPFVYYGLWDDVDYSDIKWQGHKYRQRDLNKKLLIDSRDDAIIKEFKERVKDKKTIAFCCSVKHVLRCVIKFRAVGISCVGLTHKTKPEERTRILQKFRSGEYQVIFTRDIFNEGVDFPDVKALLFLRPTFSKTVFFQQIGRGLRVAKGKKNVMVLDFIGNYVNAFQIKKWLQEIVTTERMSNIKPEFEYEVPKVFFDGRVIELFDLEEQKVITKDKLIENYKKIKKSLDRIPKASEMKRYGLYHPHSYAGHFGSWDDFMLHMGDRPHRKGHHISKENLLKNFYSVKKKIGRRPRETDLDNKKISSFSHTTYKTKWGSWKLFLESVNETVLSDFSLNSTKSPKNILIDYYFKVEKKLGRKPELRDFNKKSDLGISIWQYYKYFGSWKNFLEEIDETDNEKPPTKNILYPPMPTNHKKK